MRNDKHLAIALRRKGHSYKAIEEKLGVRRSTLSNWFAHLPWSRAMQRQLVARMRPFWKKNMQKLGRDNADMWRTRRAMAREEAGKEFLGFAKDPLFIAGLMLYWGEGDSKLENSQIRFTNTSPGMITIFSKFLQQYCTVLKKKIKMALILYPDLNDSFCKRYWCKQTKIPLSQFDKTQFIKGRHPTKRLAYGIGMLHVGGCERKEKIMKWIDLYQKELIR